LVEVEAPGRNAGGLQFSQVLFAQTLIGCDQQDVVQRFPVVVQKLMVIQVQNQGLATAGGHPVSQFGQVGFGEFTVRRLCWQFLCIALMDKRVQVGQQLRLVIEETVEDDFGVERG